MIPCLSYWSVRDGDKHARPIDEALAEAADAGFAGLELVVAAEGVLPYNASAEQCRSARQAINASGMVVETLASGMSWGCNPVSDNKATRQRAIELHTGALNVAAEIGLNGLLVVPGNLFENGKSIRYDIAYDRAHQAVESLLPTAEATGVDLLIENVWNGLFYSPLELCAFIDSFKHPSLGVYLDAGNLLGIHQHPADWIPILGERIRRIHIKDFQRESHNFCDLGQGDLPWLSCSEALQAIGYDKTIVAEMFPWDDGLVTRTADTLNLWLTKDAHTTVSSSTE